MVSQTAAATILLIVISLAIGIVRRRQTLLQSIGDEKSPNGLDVASDSLEDSVFIKSLTSKFPDSVITPHNANATAFKESRNSYWAQQECEVIPACIFRPRDVQELSTVITMLKTEFNRQRSGRNRAVCEGLFAVRGGGHSPIPSAASIKGGVVIDLQLFNEVTPSEDGNSVVIGAGAGRWMDVSKRLDERGLAVVGGRNSAVGVGGLTLGGMCYHLRYLLSILPFT